MLSFINALLSFFDTILHVAVADRLGTPDSAYTGCKTLADVERVNREYDRRAAA